MLRFPVFFGLVALLFLFNLTLMNDVAGLWDGAEAAFVWAGTSTGPSFPAGLVAWLFPARPVDPFWFRLPGVMLLLLSFIPLLWLGGKILGRRPAYLAALALMSSLTIPMLAKVATADAWTWAFQFTGAWFILYFLKRPAWPGRLGAYLAVSFSVLTEPLGSILFFSVFTLLLWWIHPEGRRMWRLNIWAFLLILTPVFHFADLLSWHFEGAFLGWGRASWMKYVWLNFLGFAPLAGFMVGGFRDLVYKWRKREELAIITGALLLAALLSQSPVLAFGLGLMIAKQMEWYADPRYPFRAWVRTGAILHLVVAFFVLTIGMIYGFNVFLGPGFRAGLLIAGAYWALSFLGVIGLFGFDRRLLWGGPMLAGVLAGVLFWVQGFPLLESRRDLTKKLMEQLIRLRPSEEGALCFFVPQGDPFPAAAVYGKGYFKHSGIFRSEQDLRQGMSRYGDPVVVIPEKAAEILEGDWSTTSVEGTDDRLTQRKYLVGIPLSPPGRPETDPKY